MARVRVRVVASEKIVKVPKLTKQYHPDVIA